MQIPKTMFIKKFKIKIIIKKPVVSIKVLQKKICYLQETYIIQSFNHPTNYSHLLLQVPIHLNTIERNI